MCKKFFKKNPEFQKYNIQETFFIRLQDRWARMQGAWWSQRWARTSSSKLVSFLNADKNNHNNANAILSTHERFSVEGEFDSSKVHLLNYITDWTMSQEMKEWDGSLDKHCVIKNFLDITTNELALENQSDEKKCEKLKNEDTMQKYFKKTQNYMKDKNKILKDKSLHLAVYLLDLHDMMCGN